MNCFPAGTSDKRWDARRLTGGAGEGNGIVVLLVVWDADAVEASATGYSNRKTFLRMMNESLSEIGTTAGGFSTTGGLSRAE